MWAGVSPRKRWYSTTLSKTYVLSAQDWILFGVTEIYFFIHIFVSYTFLIISRPRRHFYHLVGSAATRTIALNETAGRSDLSFTDKKPPGDQPSCWQTRAAQILSIRIDLIYWRLHGNSNFLVHINFIFLLVIIIYCLQYSVKVCLTWCDLLPWDERLMKTNAAHHGYKF